MCLHCVGTQASIIATTFSWMVGMEGWLPTSTTCVLWIAGQTSERLICARTSKGVVMGVSTGHGRTYQKIRKRTVSLTRSLSLCFSFSHHRLSLSLSLSLVVSLLHSLSFLISAPKSQLHALPTCSGHNWPLQANYRKLQPTHKSLSGLGTQRSSGKQGEE